MGGGRRDICTVIAITGISLAVLTLVLKLWRADLHIPFSRTDFDSDIELQDIIFKTVIDNGWSFHNRFLGAPFGVSLLDYPCWDNFHVFLMWLMSRVYPDWSLVMNLYYILGFPLAAVAAYFGFSCFGVGRLPAAVCGLLYAFLPFHLDRGQSHFFLTAYFLLPLLCTVVLWLAQDEPLLRPRISRRGKLSLGLCALMGPAGGSGLYFFVIALFLLATAGLYGSLLARRLRPLASAVTLAAVMTMSFLVNFSPVLRHVQDRGWNPGATERASNEVEQYGLRLTDLIFPADGHRVGSFARLKVRYDHEWPRPNEGETDALGLLGAIGLLFLLGAGILQSYPKRHGALLRAASALCLALFLLASVGGIGQAMNYFVFPFLRAYNRVCLFLAFFSFLTVALALESALSWIPARGLPRWGASLAMFGLLGLSLADQTTRTMVPDYPEQIARWRNEERFVRDIEAKLGPDAMVFQLPFVTFPGARPPHSITEYDPGRLYLHSRNTRWSFGAMKGRGPSDWLLEESSRPLPELIPRLVGRGFAGIEVDHHGYSSEEADGIHRELVRLTGAEPLRDAEGRYEFFDLRRVAPAPVLRWPLLVEWGPRFYGRESDGHSSWRLASHQIATAFLENPNPFPVTVRVRLAPFYFGKRRELRLIIGRQTWPLDFSRPNSMTLVAKPGRQALRFVSTLGPWFPPTDTRWLSFGIRDFSLEELGPAAPGTPPPPLTRPPLPTCTGE